MTYYPVIIGTLNRYQHFKNCVESLATCTHADKTELIIGLDYPPSEKYVNGWNDTKKYVTTIKGFKKVTILEREKNYGAIKNYRSLYEYAFQRYEAVITTEDDNIFSPCFLDYMNKCLERYKDDPNAIAIGGYMFPINWKQGLSSNVIHLYDYDAWGSGKWKYKDERINKELEEPCLQWFCGNKKFLKELKNFPVELSHLIFWIKNKPILNRRCDFTLTCYNIVKKSYMIRPTLSLVRNMGNDGTGENNGDLGSNDIYCNQKISEQEIFHINDTLSDSELKQCIEDWNNYNLRTFSKKDSIKVKIAYWLILSLGYRVGNILLSLLLFLWKIQKNVFINIGL